jgi:hypothetical protein
VRKFICALSVLLTLSACAAKTQPTVDPEDPTKADRIEDQLREMRVTMLGLQDDLIKLANERNALRSTLWASVGVPAVAPDNKLRIAGQPLVDEPVARAGSMLLWSTPTINPTVLPNRYEISYDGVPFQSIGLVLTVAIPTMPSGLHTARVRACNVDGCSNDVDVTQVASLTFKFVNALPGPPTGLTITPPQLVLSLPQAAQLAQCTVYGAYLRWPTESEFKHIVDTYPGPIPPTYGSVTFHLDSFLVQR